MKTLLSIISGLFTGYIIGKINDHSFEDIIEDLNSKIKVWVEVILDLATDTINSIEGFDSDMIRMNIEVFIDMLKESSDKYLEIETFEEKLEFVESKIAEITTSLLENSKLINKK